MARRIKAFEAAKDSMSEEEIIKWKYQRYVKDYLRCVKSVDDGIGEILDYLDEAGLADNTIVMYSSDQGWYLGEHGWFDKRWMYEESLRTPLLVRWPGVDPRLGPLTKISFPTWILPKRFSMLPAWKCPVTCKDDRSFRSSKAKRRAIGEKFSITTITKTPGRTTWLAITASPTANTS